MRPVKLSMENIGPFSGRVVLDFRTLSDIFLVTGKTGSGKSTIFDALCYGLYGTLPGARKGMQRKLRSDFAEEGEDSLVSVEFELDGHHYRVDRRPPRLRKKKRGEGSVEDSEEAAIYRMSAEGLQPLSSKKSEADEKVRELIGLSPDEFSKVVLLPQGEFAEFLRQGTNDRRDVLKKLFPIDLADRVKESVSTAAKDAASRLKEAERAVAERVGAFDPDRYDSDFQDAKIRLQDAKAESARLRAEVERLSQAEAAAAEQAENRRRLEAEKRRLAELQGDEQDLQAKAALLAASRKAHPLLPLARRMEETEGEAKRWAAALETARHSMEEAKAAWELVNAEAPRTAEEEARLIRLRETRGKLQEAAELELRVADDAVSVDALRLQAQRAERALGELAEQRAELQSKMEAESVEAEALAGLEEEYEGARGALDSSRATAQLAQKAAELQSEVQELMKAEEAARARFAATEEAWTNFDAETKRLEELRKAAEDAEKASSLAATLVTGKPCPVCGSTEHPHPATAEATVYNLSIRASSLSLSRDEAAEEKRKASIALANAEDRTTRAKRELSALGAGPFPDLASAGVEVRRLAELLNSLQERLKVGRQARSRLDGLRRSLDVLTRESEELGKTRQEKRESLTALEAAWNERKRSLARVMEVAGLSSGPGARHALETLDRELGTLQEKVGSRRRRMEEAGVERAKAETVLTGAQASLQEAREMELRARTEMVESLDASPFSTVREVLDAALEEVEERAIEETLKSRERAIEASRSLVGELERMVERKAGEEGSDLVAIGELLMAAREGLDASDELRDDAAVRLAELTKANSDWEDKERRRAELSAESASLKALADDLSGANPKKRPFDAFLLGFYLEEVAAYATRRLERMSEGRYHLVLDTEGPAGNAQTGLDLVVFDSFTGRKRPCATLSGGESFMASISLALGLADSIQARSGGVRLDAVFIDEGFGSLDEASLDRALSILDEVRGSRMVGLISHVPELKVRIPSRVEVIKGSAGSSIKVRSL